MQKFANYFITFGVLAGLFFSPITASARERSGMGGGHARSSASFSHTGARGTITRSVNNSSVDNTMTHTTSLSLADQNGHTVTRNTQTTNNADMTSHSVDRLALAPSIHVSMHRTTQTTLNHQADSAKSFDRTVSAKKSTIGEVINGRTATTHVEQGNITHEGWVRATSIPTSTSFAHDVNSSIIKNEQNQVQVDHTGETSKFFQEAVVGSYTSDIHTSIEK